MNNDNLNLGPNYQNNFNPEYPKQDNQVSDFQQPNYYTSPQDQQSENVNFSPEGYNNFNPNYYNPQSNYQQPTPQYQNNPNFYQYQNPPIYNPYLQQPQPKKSAYVLSIIGFIMGCFALVTGLFFMYIIFASSNSSYDESNALFSIFGIFASIGMYSQLPGLICSIIGRVLSTKIYQIKPEKAKLFSTLGIVFCAITMFSTIVLIIWGIHGLASVYSQY